MDMAGENKQTKLVRGDGGRERERKKASVRAGQQTEID